jgi:MoxR-like ATPase
MPYLSLDCSEGTRDRHLKGGYTVNSQGSTPFILGTIANAVQVANEYGLAMLVFEELNALSPQLQKDVNALTDFRKKIEVPELSYRFSLLPGKRLFIGATMNPAVYGGTYELNRDLKNRFIEVDVPYPPPDQEKKLLRAMAPALPEDTLNRLVDIAQHTRQEATAYSLSPRDLVQVISMIPRVGWTDALFLAAQKFSDADRTLIIDRIKDITKTSIYPDLTERMKVLNIGGSTA